MPENLLSQQIRLALLADNSEQYISKILVTQLPVVRYPTTIIETFNTDHINTNSYNCKSLGELK